jgi:rRNA maturation protein Nop10
LPELDCRQPALVPAPARFQPAAPHQETDRFANLLF